MRNMHTALPLRVNACPVCGRVPQDGNPVWLVGFVVTDPDPEADSEEHFDELDSAQEEARRLGVAVHLDLSDGCRTPDLRAVPYAP